METGRISERDLALLMVTTLLGTVVFFLPSIVADALEQDSWMAAHLASVWAILVVLVVLALARRFPGHTFIQILADILGKPLGKALGLLYVFWFSFGGATVLRQAGMFLNVTNLNETPVGVFTVTLLLVVMYAVKTGLENWVKINTLLIWVIILIILAIIILPYPMMDPGHLLPLGNHSLGSLLVASMIGGSFRGEIILAGMFIPALANPGKTGRNLILAVIAVGFILAGVEIACSMVFGGARTATFEFPIYSLARIITLGRIIDRLEVLTVVIFILGIFFKVAVFFYSSVLGLAQVIEARDYQFLILPMGVLWVAMADNAVANTAELASYFVNGFPGLGLLSFELVIPLVLLLIATVLRRRRETES